MEGKTTRTAAAIAALKNCINDSIEDKKTFFEITIEAAEEIIELLQNTHQIEFDKMQAISDNERLRTAIVDAFIKNSMR